MARQALQNTKRFKTSSLLAYYTPFTFRKRFRRQINLRPKCPRYW